VVACGSGGTVAGIALGVILAGLSGTPVHAVGVCDSPEAFYAHVREIAAELGIVVRTVTRIHDRVKEQLARALLRRGVAEAPPPSGRPA
jgi:1-aminocyclopropane-1-carboxylate deaminase/D-cysteine desulfhydrase-like pyridoxal-dependent ACC family enzyme